MAKQTVGQAAKFFELNARYEIVSGSALDSLAKDAQLLLLAGMAVFQETYEDLSQAQWASLYMLKQAAAVLEQLEHRIEMGEVSHG